MHIWSFLKLSKIRNSPHFKSALPYIQLFISYTKIYFAENQLYLSLISLSLLTTSHPNLFQQKRVRSSNMYFYKIFNLLMVRSLSFGFYIYDFKILFKIWFIYAYYIPIKLAININSLAHYAKGTLLLLQRCKASTDCLHYILGSFNTKKVLFHLSLTVLVHYRLLKIIRFESRFPK